ncbi:MAG TPA: MFS transporter [Actinoplanes sp.]|nr:MFS transporter [Actinoplanes sp.]
MAAPIRTRGSLLLLAYLGFVSLGLPDGLLGVGWPSIRDEFAVSTASVGFVLAVGTAGYLAASVAGGFSVARLGVGLLLTVSTLTAAVALIGYALSPTFVVLVCLALLLGLGSGAVDSGLNAYAAVAFGPRHMNWLHAFFGFGVALGPLIMTAVLQAGYSWRWGYVVVAAAQILLAIAFGLRIQSWTARAVGVAAAGAQVRRRATLTLPAVWVGALSFAVYTGIELGAGLWAFVLLTDGRGLSVGAAGAGVSAYWGALFVGRIVFGVVAERVGSRAVLTTGLVGVVAGTALLALPAPAAVAVAGLVVTGFAAAPVFPLLTLTTADRVGAAHADRAIGLQIAAAGLGGAAVPAGIGAVMQQHGVDWLGPALLGMAVALLVLTTAQPTRRRAGSPPGRETPPAPFAPGA